MADTDQVGYAGESREPVTAFAGSPDARSGETGESAAGHLERPGRVK